MNKIKELILKKKFDNFITEYSIEEICTTLNFSETMHLVNHLAYDDFQNDDY